VRQLAVRVKRVGVDDGEACAQRPEHGDGVLQQVRHHQRDAVALAEAGVVLKPGSEFARRLVELPERQLTAHLGVGVTVREFREAALGELGQGRKARRIDGRWYAGRI
jgi:hypothetical protein